MTFRGNWPCPSPRCHHVPNPCIFSPARPPSYTVNTKIYPAIHAHTIDNRRTPCPPALGRPAQDHLRSLDPSCKIWRSRHPHLRTGCAPRLAANGPLHPSSAHQPGQRQPHTQTHTQRRRKNIPSGSMETAARAGSKRTDHVYSCLVTTGHVSNNPTNGEVGAPSGICGRGLSCLAFDY